MTIYVKFLSIYIIFFFVLVGSQTNVFAAKHAFVLGNSSYVHVTKLDNPVHDAIDIANKFSQMGYIVHLHLDKTRESFASAFADFANLLNKEDLAVFYYAGHGIQVAGENYLVPVDAFVRNEKDAKKNLITLNNLLKVLSDKVDTRIIVLDACRNNPFAKKRSLNSSSAIGGRGLARVYAGGGSFIAFSTQPGNTAEDGTGQRNSPFTSALLKHIKRADSDVHEVLRNVRADVLNVTGKRQIPWENSSLTKKVSFSQGISLIQERQETASRPQRTKTQQQLTRQTERYHYVTGLDPYGDNFLALRTGPGSQFSRVATMGPNTPVKIIEDRGRWKRIVLTDGSGGWAFGKYIACCRNLSIIRSKTSSFPLKISPLPQTEASCYSLWFARNRIFKSYKYCFRTEKAKRALGNEGCFRNNVEVKTVMSASDKARVNDLLYQERNLGCR